MDLNNFVHNTAGRAHSPSGMKVPDADRLNHVQSKSLNISRRRNDANSGQQRHNQAQGQLNMRKEILQNQHQRTAGAFDGSVLGDETVTSIGEGHTEETQVVEETQLESQGHSGAYHGDRQSYVEDADSQGHDESGDEDHLALEREGVHKNTWTGALAKDAQALDNVTGFIHRFRPGQDHVQDGPFDKHQAGDSYPATTSGRQSQIGDPAVQYDFGAGATNAGYHTQAPRHTRTLERPVQRGPSMPQHRTEIAHHTALAPRNNITIPRQKPGIPSAPLQPEAGSMRDGSGMNRATNMQAPQPGLAYFRPQTPHQDRTQLHQPLAYHEPAPKQPRHNANERTHSGGSAQSQSVMTVRAPAAPAEDLLPPTSLFNVAIDQDLDTPFEKLHQDFLNGAAAQHSDAFGDDGTARALIEELEHVERLDKNEKQNLIASLTPAQWEEAGDWFLDRFSDIVGKMKDARKERKKLANDFSREMLKRHQKVQAKKRSIDDALADMGKSGANVLRASTPHKKKARV